MFNDIHLWVKGHIYKLRYGDKTAILTRYFNKNTAESVAPISSFHPHSKLHQE